MGLLDTIKGLVKGKEDEIGKGIDKAADLVDDKTGGKYDDQIDAAADKAKDVVEDLDES
jgi:hypothetical protein